MKYYRLEPTYKKSVVEQTLYYKDGVYANFEEGYRWGQFIIYIPETEQEFEDWTSRFGKSLEDYEHVFSDDNIKDKYLAICGPDLECDYLTLEGLDHDMIELSDGCWSSWHVQTEPLGSSEEGEPLLPEEEEDLIDYLSELYDEGYGESVENAGWKVMDNWTEIQSTVTMVPCDVNGYDQVK